MKTNKNWVTTAKRFVVFLDIMGFKDLVYRNPHKTVYEKLEFISQIKNRID